MQGSKSKLHGPSNCARCGLETLDGEALPVIKTLNEAEVHPSEKFTFKAAVKNARSTYQYNRINLSNERSKSECASPLLPPSELMHRTQIVPFPSVFICSFVCKRGSHCCKLPSVVVRSTY